MKRRRSAVITASVLAVTRKSMSARCKLNSYLVSSARDKMDRKKTLVLPP